MGTLKQVQGDVPFQNDTFLFPLSSRRYRHHTDVLIVIPNSFRDPPCAAYDAHIDGMGTLKQVQGDVPFQNDTFLFPLSSRRYRHHTDVLIVIPNSFRDPPCAAYDAHIDGMGTLKQVQGDVPFQNDTFLFPLSSRRYRHHTDVLIVIPNSFRDPPCAAYDAHIDGMGTLKQVQGDVPFQGDTSDL